MMQGDLEKQTARIMWHRSTAKRMFFAVSLTNYCDYFSWKVTLIQIYFQWNANQRSTAYATRSPETPSRATRGTFSTWKDKKFKQACLELKQYQWKLSKSYCLSVIRFSGSYNWGLKNKGSSWKRYLNNNNKQLGVSWRREIQAFRLLLISSPRTKMKFLLQKASIILISNLI